jgi:copper(I)-binding protein
LRTVASTVEQEARVDRLKLAAAGGLAAAVVLTGCGAGQVSQMTTQEPAVNGTSANVGEIALRNVHLRAEQTSDYVQPGTEVELLFQAANNSPDTEDKLLEITSDVGEVTLTGDTTVEPDGVLIVGSPDGQPTPLQNVEAAEAAEAAVELTKPITNGLTYQFTFKFEKAGETTVAVPISAGDAPRRGEAPATSGSGGHGGGH